MYKDIAVFKVKELCSKFPYCLSLRKLYYKTNLVGL